MHPKLLWFRYKLFRYRALEQRVAARHKRLLDVGCGDGENLLRFASSGVQRTGIEVSFGRLRIARAQGLDVAAASGTDLPFAHSSFDLLYIAHVLHHVADYSTVLNEMNRVLDRNGELVVVETVVDHPLLRLGRKIYPYWRGDQVEASWTYAELGAILRKAGFEIVETGRYNILFWLWEMLPLWFWPFEIVTPFFVVIDLVLERFFLRYAAHCYFVLRQATPESRQSQ